MVSVPASPPLGGRCGCGGVWTARPCGGMDEADEMQVKTAEAARRGRDMECADDSDKAVPPLAAGCALRRGRPGPHMPGP